MSEFGKWEPIDTAPKEENEPILACDKYGDVFIIEWSGVNQYGDNPPEDYFWFKENDEPAELEELKYWMPLPPPPTE